MFLERAGDCLPRTPIRGPLKTSPRVFWPNMKGSSRPHGIQPPATTFFRCNAPTKNTPSWEAHAHATLWPYLAS